MRLAVWHLPALVVFPKPLPHIQNKTCDSLRLKTKKKLLTVVYQRRGKKEVITLQHISCFVHCLRSSLPKHYFTEDYSTVWNCYVIRWQTNEDILNACSYLTGRQLWHLLKMLSTSFHCDPFSVTKVTGINKHPIFGKRNPDEWPHCPWLLCCWHVSIQPVSPQGSCYLMQSFRSHGAVLCTFQPYELISDQSGWTMPSSATYTDGGVCVCVCVCVWIIFAYCVNLLTVRQIRFK